jgi:alpha-1,6-mannosyltransferase
MAGSPRMRIVEPISDRARLATLMASADVLVHGCDAETYGLVVAEARASGLPLIVPDGGGALEQLQQGAGIAYSSRTPRSLEEAIIRVADERENFRQIALQRSRVPTLERHFEQLFQHFEKLDEPRVPNAFRAAA